MILVGSEVGCYLRVHCRSVLVVCCLKNGLATSCDEECYKWLLLFSPFIVQHGRNYIGLGWFTELLV